MTETATYQKPDFYFGKNLSESGVSGKESINYYPFGMVMPGRHFDAVNGYRYGFNGKENDTEYGTGGLTQDYGFRMYNPALGRFLSTDPLSKDYPWYTPYQFAGNKPIHSIDIDGLEEYVKIYCYENGKATHIKTITNSEIRYRSVRTADGNVQRSYVIDKRTGEPMSNSEIGMVQYQYVDPSGHPLNLRRDFEGNYVVGSNEFMPLGEDNYFGSIYIGANNPTYTDEHGNEMPDYRREPLDEVDAAALHHDKNYDKVGAAGAWDALFNNETRPADEILLESARIVEEKYSTGATDEITGKPVSSLTNIRAQAVEKFFGLIIEKLKTGSSSEGSTDSSNEGFKSYEPKF